MANQLNEEIKKIEEEVKEAESAFKKLTKNVWVTSLLVGIIILSIVGGIIYWKISSEYIYTDNAVISAKVTNLTPTFADILNKIFVNVGDEAPANTVVAQVGNQLLKTKTI